MIRSTPGALFNALGGFAKNNVNLTKLESFSVNNTFMQTILLEIILNLVCIKLEHFDFFLILQIKRI